MSRPIKFIPNGPRPTTLDIACDRAMRKISKKTKKTKKKK